MMYWKLSQEQGIISISILLPQRGIQKVKGLVAGDSSTVGELEYRPILRLYCFVLGLRNSSLGLHERSCSVVWLCMVPLLIQPFLFLFPIFPICTVSLYYLDLDFIQIYISSSETLGVFLFYFLEPDLSLTHILYYVTTLQ